jgi:hypothetical protein
MLRVKYLVYLVMGSNKYIRRLIRMYQNSYLKQLDEILKSRPENWDECKEYFKAWIEKLFLDKKIFDFVSDNWSKGSYSFLNNIREYIKERLDKETLS